MFFGSVLLASACMETRRSTGDDCLKDDDCLSGVCFQLRCATAPPTVDAMAVADATGAPPSGSVPDATVVQDDATGGDDAAQAQDEEAADGGSSADVLTDSGGSG